VFDTAEKVKGANPAARYCCDPVIGNFRRGIFVREGVPDFIKGQLLTAADVLTPNQFELNFLTDTETESLAAALAAIDALHERGPRVVLVTSLKLEDTPDDAFDMLVSSESGRYRLRTPRLPILPNGAGDVMAALFFAHYLQSGEAAEAMSLAASSLFGVLNRTVDEGSNELLLVQAQEEFVKPRRIYAAKPVAK
jgi:pyridoxine kinase